MGFPLVKWETVAFDKDDDEEVSSTSSLGVESLSKYPLSFPAIGPRTSFPPVDGADKSMDEPDDGTVCTLRNAKSFTSC